MSKCVGSGLKNQDRLFGDFGTDTVAREDGEVQEHAGISLMETALRCRPGSPGGQGDRESRYTPQR